MSITPFANRVREQRLQRGWSQADLAQHTGISRAAVSAIEGQRLVPSVATALALARTFDVSVEQLFGPPRVPAAESQWAWTPPHCPWRYWQAEVAGRVLSFPVERTGEANFFHDGVSTTSDMAPPATKSASETLVLASCDPAAGLLAGEYQRQTGLRMIVLTRSSRDALELLRKGLVHVAGMHYTTTDAVDENDRIAHSRLGNRFTLLRVAEWQEGIAVASGMNARSVQSVLRSKPRWVGREVGSAARDCLDHLLASKQTIRHVATDHRSVAAAIQSGWADAGVCLRLVTEDAGLQFVSVQEESYDLCFLQSLERDPRIQALVSMFRSTAFRSLIADLPGYDARHTGEIHTCT